MPRRSATTPAWPCGGTSLSALSVCRKCCPTTIPAPRASARPPLLVGACRPEAVVWDISDPANPVRLYGVPHPVTGGTWHSASLTWDGKLFIMGWEPGGGSQPRCQATGTDLGGGLLQTDEMKSVFFYLAANGAPVGRWTLPRPQSAAEN